MLKNLPSPLKSSIRRFFTSPSVSNPVTVSPSKSSRDFSTATATAKKFINNNAKNTNITNPSSSAGNRMANASKVISASTWTLILAGILPEIAHSKAETEEDKQDNIMNPYEVQDECPIPERSSNAHEHPSYPGLNVLTGYDLQEIIQNYNQNQNSCNYFIEIYAPWCSTCALFAPVIRTAAQVLDELSHKKGINIPLKICILDGEENNLPGFLGENEEDYPTMKFIPANNKPNINNTTNTNNNNNKNNNQSITTLQSSRPFNISALLSNLHKMSNGAFDLQDALAIVPRYEHKLNEAIHQVLATQNEDPLLQLYLNSPCGREQFAVTNHRVASKFMRDSVQIDRKEEELLQNFQKCKETSVDDMKTYWEKVRAHAHSNAKAINQLIQSAPESIARKPEN